ncbi:hypothetical protein [Stenotrophomonas sp. PS02301]|uniref:hypothetical protein n=1 Tax=Stenotrophomonas sp. PS02301 TaxID=2991427 RepID=UPI00249B6B7A|nr:hypothetical protein [Stenotrophomonas sp. PS02301]
MQLSCIRILGPLGLFGCLAAATAFANERSFMGIEVGAPAPSECPTERSAYGPDRYSYSEGKAPCWSKIGGTPDGRGLTSNGVTTVQMWINSDSRPHGTSMPYAEIADGKVESVSVETTGFADQDSILSALTKKYGKPTLLEREPVQTGVGAKFDRIHASWKKPDLNVEFFGMLGSVTEGNISVRTDAGKSRFEEQYGKEKSF